MKRQLKYFLPLVAAHISIRYNNQLFPPRICMMSLTEHARQPLIEMDRTFVYRTNSFLCWIVDCGRKPINSSCFLKIERTMYTNMHERFPLSLSANSKWPLLNCGPSPASILFYIVCNLNIKCNLLSSIELYQCIDLISRLWIYDIWHKITIINQCQKRSFKFGISKRQCEWKANKKGNKINFSIV